MKIIARPIIKSVQKIVGLTGKLSHPKRLKVPYLVSNRLLVRLAVVVGN